MPDPAEVVGLDPDPLHALAYVSTPTVPFSDRDLSDLLLAARRFNATRDVTGKLVVLEAAGRVVRFAQWVEGPAAQLAVVVDRIRADPRHADVEVRFEGPVGRRRFANWQMAFAPVGEARIFASDAAALVAA